MNVQQRRIGLVMLAVAIAATLIYGGYALRNPKPENVPPFDVSVAWDGTIRVNGEPVTCEELHARLRLMDPAPDPADAREQDAKRCAETAKVTGELSSNIREENGIRIFTLQGGTVLNLKSGDKLSVDRSGKARWNGQSVSCADARARVIATINVRPFPDEKLAALVPCRN